jgi:hypothetical protein
MALRRRRRRQGRGASSVSHKGAAARSACVSQVPQTRFVTVADGAESVVANMPPKKAGTLSNEEDLATVAFDLRANGIGLGPEVLKIAMARELVIPRR